MKKLMITAGALALVSLSGCVGVAESAPYYGGVAPYYATTYQPAYVYGSAVVGTGYYPYHVNAHSAEYHNAYWHSQRGTQQATIQEHMQQRGGAAPQQHSAPQRGEEREEKR